MGRSGPRATGGCLCGAVRYEVHGKLRKVVYCHCEQCRKTTGHFVAATAVQAGDLKVTEDSGLAWYESSDIAKRGFCDRCGSGLFWQPSHEQYTAVWAGTIVAPTHLVSQVHIHVDDKSDYYEITDGLPQYPQEHVDLWVDNDT
ncbi:MAG: GFA family protein [Woeseiaceae bacterium]